MEKIYPEIEEVLEDVKDYVNTSIDLYKLKTTEKGAEMASEAIIYLFIGVFAVLTLIFSSFAIAYAIGESTGKIYVGFLIVAAFYALTGIIILISKDKWLKGTLINNIIKSVYRN